MLDPRRMSRAAVGGRFVGRTLAGAAALLASSSIFLAYGTPPAGTHDPAPPPQPNIVLIMADDYVAFGMLRPGETTFAHILERAGYATGITGKWQVDEGPWEARYKNPRITITGRDPQIFEGGHPVEFGTHVPLLARWLGTIPAASLDSGLVDFTDFLPTLVEVAGAEVPDGLPLDGQSFLHRLKGDPGPQREWVFGHYTPRWGDFAEVRYVHDTEWKLHEDGRVFNIKTDPLEETPLDEEDVPPEARERLRTFRVVLESKQETPS